MSRRSPDRSLRRLVAELATVAPEDIETVLDDLDPPQRRQFQALMAEYLGQPVAAPLAPEVAPVAGPSAPPGLSPWLAARIDEPESFAMAPAARTALRACAASLEPEEAPGSPPREPVNWLDRLLRRGAAP